MKRVDTNLKKLFTKGKTLMLAYDQGLEHGPSDFNDKNADPNYIINIAKKGKFNAFICHKGIVEKYQEEIKKTKIPLIIKLNGKTSLKKGDPISEQDCSVKRAIELGAMAVGYTIYIGSEFEDKIFEDFAKIQEEAHEKGLPVIAWIYPRGKSLKGKKAGDLMVYAARVGLELGADVVKIKYEGTKKDLEKAVKNAGKTKIVIAGGNKKGEKELLKEVKEIMDAGCVGLAIGRNVWQAEDPVKVGKDLKKVVFS